MTAPFRSDTEALLDRVHAMAQENAELERAIRALRASSADAQRRIPRGPLLLFVIGAAVLAAMFVLNVAYQLRHPRPKTLLHPPAPPSSELAPP